MSAILLEMEGPRFGFRGEKIRPSNSVTLTHSCSPWQAQGLLENGDGVTSPEKVEEGSGKRGRSRCGMGRLLTGYHQGDPSGVQLCCGGSGKIKGSY